MHRPLSVLLLCLSLVLLFAFATAAINEPKEANIQGVDYLRNGDDITFWVTIYDENDETGDSYAAWWQVETRDGELLGRHELNNTGETTIQSEATFPIPQDIRYITVRGYDNTRGYGGQIVELDIIGEDQSSAEGEEEETSSGSGSGGSDDDDEETDETGSNTSETGDGDTVGNDAGSGGEGDTPGQGDNQFSPPEVFNELLDQETRRQTGTTPLLWVGLILLAGLIVFLARRHYDRFQ